MASYHLSPEALADLFDIADYSKRNWGAVQAAKYRNQLEDCAEALATGNGRFKDHSDIRSGLRVARCQHHYIYCVIRDGEPALIVSLLHERMDLMARISERLK